MKLDLLPLFLAMMSGLSRSLTSPDDHYWTSGPVSAVKARVQGNLVNLTIDGLFRHDPSTARSDYDI